MDERLDHSFTRWLFRPYLDLGPAAPDGPHHLQGIEFGFRSLTEDKPYPRIQSALNPSFRDVLIHDTGLFDYRVATPLDLPEHLQTDRWRALCEAIRSYDSLPSRSQVRLTWTVAKMCFQQAMLDLVPASIVERISASNDDASLAYLRAYSRYRMNLDNPSLPYSMEEFAKIANEAPPGIARIDAHYQMVVQNVKNHNNLPLVEFWHAKHLTAIEQSRPELDEFTYLLVMSRYYRVGGFLPQMRREIEPMVYEMDLAEKYALALPRPDEAYRIAADEMLYPVLESRTKEAVWLKDYDLALERAQRTVKLSPYDARAWLHLGQVYVDREEPEQALAAYRRSARLAPPGREIAWFMAGQCYEVLDDLESACDAYLTSLQADPLGIAAAERLEAIATQLDHGLILRWVRPRLEELNKLKVHTPAPLPQPYKDLPPPLEAAKKAAGTDSSTLQA
jgi:tetratricopeptide (TPR) repeat protein